MYKKNKYTWFWALLVCQGFLSMFVWLCFAMGDIPKIINIWSGFNVCILAYLLSYNGVKAYQNNW